MQRFMVYDPVCAFDLCGNWGNCECLGGENKATRGINE